MGKTNQVDTDYDVVKELNLARDSRRSASSATSEDSELYARIDSAIQDGNLSDEVTRALQTQLRLLFGEVWENENAFAVRSSAVGEDGADASSAGQMSTILGVVGTEKILAAIRQCWASAFTKQAVLYRRQTGQNIATCCGVVIQQIVKSETSGVAFTCDPVTGHPGRIVINANYGLGESVVSGEVEPDTIILERSYSNHIQLLNVNIGKKGVRTSLVDGFVLTTSTDEDDKHKACLSTDEITRLSNVAVEIESYYRGPRDIEWAFDANGNLCILQARAITNLGLESDFELLHEFDTAIYASNMYSTTANVGEVMGGANTPLGLSIPDAVIEKAVQYNLVHNKGMSRMRPDVTHSYTIYRNHLMLNLFHTLYSDPAIVKRRGVAELCVLGRKIDDADLEGILQARAADSTVLQSIARFCLTMTLVLRAKSKRQACSIKYGPDYNVDYEDCKTSKDAYDKLTDLIPALCEVWECHIGSTTYSAVWYHLIMDVLTKQNPIWTNDNFSDLALIYSACTQVESADVPVALQTLADKIIQCIPPEEFASMDPMKALDWLQNPADENAATHEFREFLKKHGHRCIREIDFYEKAWIENPAAVVEALQHSIKYASSASSAIKNSTAESTSDSSVDAVLSQLKTSLSFVERLLFKWAIPNARCGVGYREQTKSIAIRVGLAARKGYRKLGALLVQEGKLPETELLYYLTHFELGQLAGDTMPSTQLIKRAQLRRKIHAQQQSITLAQISIGVPKEVNQTFTAIDHLFLTTSVAHIDFDGELKGTPVSSGSIKAMARVAVTLNEAKDLQKGEILITRSTDIAWSVYFPILGGVITELGGLLSHGAVVAREYGLPCLVSVENATHFFKTGDLVFLDGAKGTIARIKPTE